jgi:hypothetical protein
MIKRIKRFFKRKIGYSTIVKNQKGLIESQKLIIDGIINISKKSDELIKASVFNSTIVDSKWLINKSFSPGGWAVDYSLLYTMFRVLNDMKPKAILEFGLGQSSKIIHQYANYYESINAITCEHDEQWIKFFKESLDGEYPINIREVELSETEYKGEKTLSIKNVNLLFMSEKYDFIVVDAPFGSSRYSRSQVIYLVENHLNNTFVIIIDDYDRLGEQETAEEVMLVLNRLGINYRIKIYNGSKQHILICSDNLGFLTTL